MSLSSSSMGTPSLASLGSINTRRHPVQRSNTSTSPRSNTSASGMRSRSFPLSCNKCRRPVDSTIIVCSCRCLFCETCAYNHFQSNPNCPSCGTRLRENDFTEVMISDPENPLVNDPNQVFQNFMTRISDQPGIPLTWNDLCTAMLREQDALFSNTKLFVKQFRQEAQRRLEEGKNAMLQVQAYRKQLTLLKEDIIGLKRQREQDMERIRQKDRQLSDKDRQIQQLRYMIERNCQGGVKEKSLSINNGQQSIEWRPPSTGLDSSSTDRSIRNKSTGFQNFVRKKEAIALSQERSFMKIPLKTNSRTKPFLR